MEDNLKWKMIFNGRQPSMLDDLQREETEVLNKGLPKLEFDTKDHVLYSFIIVRILVLV